MNKIAKTLLIVILLMVQINGHTRVEPTSGHYYEVVEDISVKVPGGHVSWSRLYEQGQWKFNPAWDTLVFEINPTDLTVLRIIRGGDSYEKLDSAGTIFKFGPRMKLRKKSDHSGWTWTDRDGNFMHYNNDGRANSMGHITGYAATFLYETAMVNSTQVERLVGVRNAKNLQVLTFGYHTEHGQLQSVSDYEGRQVIYQWQVVDESATPKRYKLAAVTDLRGFNWTYDYSNTPNDDGYVNLTQITDPELKIKTIEYGGSGRVKSITNVLGHKAHYVFDYLKGKKEYYLKTTFPGGRVTESWFKRDGELARHDINGFTVRSITQDLRAFIETDAYGKQIRRDFDEFRNIKKITFPDGTFEEYTFDVSNSNLLTMRDRNGVLTTYSYVNNNLFEVVEAVGEPAERIHRLTHDAYGQVTEVRSLADAQTAESVKTYEYDDHGNMNKATDGRLNERFFTHDARGNVKTYTDARTKLWTFEYDDAGNMTLKQTPNQFETKYKYNKLGHLLEVEHPDQSKRFYESDPLGRGIKVTDEMGGELITEYSSAGSLSKAISEEGNETTYTYDDFGRMTAMITASGLITTYSYQPLVDAPMNSGAFYQPTRVVFPTYSMDLRYDLQNRIIQETRTYEQAGETKIDVMNIEYDAVGNIIETSGNAERTITFEYDALNRRTHRYHEGVLQQQYRYDDRDNMIEFYDAKLNRHRFEYDLANNLKDVIRPMNEAFHFIYDENNYVTFKEDAMGNRIEYLYDDDSRQVGTRSFRSIDGQQQLVNTITYTLNNRGAIERYEDGTLVGTATYDFKLNKLSETLTVHGHSFNHSYEYFKDGLTKSFTGVDGIKYPFSYDDARLAKVVIPNQGDIVYSDFKVNKPQQVTMPGGVVKQMTYDGLQRTMSITATDAQANPIQEHVYGYNDYGFMTSKETQQGNHVFGYDNLDQLISATHPSLPTEGYQYDAVGNRTTSLTTNDAIWQYNANNQLVDAITQSYVYDDNGNMTQVTDAGLGVLNNYVYDEAMRLTQIQDGGGTATHEYHYDPFGRRIFKKDLANNETTYFHYGKEGLIHERLADGSTVNYLHEPHQLEGAKPILKKSAEGYFYYLNDHLGTPHKIIDSQGVVQLAREFSAFGESHDWQAVNGHTDPLMMPGQYADPESFTYHNFNRDYAPGLGRYIQRDPLGVYADANEYVYVSNAPLRYTDPTGLLKFDGGICLGLGARTCGKLKFEFSWTCVKVKICLSFRIGTDITDADDDRPKFKGSAGIGPYKRSKGGTNRFDNKERFFPGPPPPPSSCASASFGCEIHVPFFHAGAGLSSSSGYYGNAGATLDNLDDVKLGCKLEGCIELYNSCDKCPKTNPCAGGGGGGGGGGNGGGW